MKNYFSLASPHTFYVISDKGNAFWGDRKINCNKKHSEDSHITTDDYPKMPLLRRVEQGQCDGCAWLKTKLQRQRDGEQRAVDMLLMDDVDKLLHDSGMLGGEVVVLVQVGFEIVEMEHTLDDHQFPIASAHGNLVGFGKHPIEMGVALLLGIVPKERWHNEKSVEIVSFKRRLR